MDEYEFIEMPAGELQDPSGHEIFGFWVTYRKFERDASFDYAGTHCTSGRSGTHYCTEEVVEDVLVKGYEYAIEGKDDPESTEFHVCERKDISDKDLAYYEEIVEALV